MRDLCMVYPMHLVWKHGQTVVEMDEMERERDHPFQLIALQKLTECLLSVLMTSITI